MIVQPNSKMMVKSLRIFLGKCIKMYNNRVNKILRTSKKGKVKKKEKKNKKNKKNKKDKKKNKKNGRVLIKMKIKAKSLSRKFQAKCRLFSKAKQTYNRKILLYINFLTK